MSHHGAHDKRWTPIKDNGLEGRYRVEDEQVYVQYEGREAVVEARNMVAPLANAAAEGLARLKLAELIAATAGG